MSALHGFQMLFVFAVFYAIVSWMTGRWGGP
jgi:hypothetical protein